MALRSAVATRVIERLGSTWDQRLGELHQFKELNGHCNVPLRYPANRALGSWVIAQRALYKKEVLSEDRIINLTNLGFIWDILDAEWEGKFSELCSFREAFGHCNVPNQWKEDKKLSNWVARLRLLKKTVSPLLDPETMHRLDALGFDWEPRLRRSASVWVAR